MRALAATRNHITPNELAALLDEHQVTGTQARVLTKWLHELGGILFFQDVDELNGIVILNSSWVTEAISRVLESEEVAAQDGIFSRDCMNGLWRDSGWMNCSVTRNAPTRNSARLAANWQS